MSFYKAVQEIQSFSLLSLKRSIPTAFQKFYAVEK